MIEVRRLGPQIGAEINGVDIKTMDDATFDVIYRAWLDYNVIAAANTGGIPGTTFSARASAKLWSLNPLTA